MENNWKIFCDLDGVLAEFEKEFEKFGKGPIKDYKKTHSTDDLWKLIKEEDPNYFFHLDMTSDGKQLWNFIKEYEPTILTKIPYNLKNATSDKKKWVKKHLGEGLKVLTTTGKKSKYIVDNGILIDDMDENIEDWEKAGGTAVKHTSAETTIKKLKKIFDKKEAAIYKFIGITSLEELIKK